MNDTTQIAPETKFFGLEPCSKRELAIIRLREKALALKEKFPSPCCDASINIVTEGWYEKKYIDQDHILKDGTPEHFEKDNGSGNGGDADTYYKCSMCDKDISEHFRYEDLEQYQSDLEHLIGLYNKFEHFGVE